MLADSGPFSWTSRCSLGALVGLRHGDQLTEGSEAFQRRPAWRTFTQPISKRFLSGVITGLRHGDLAYRCFRAISAWRSGGLRALRHGDPAQRCLRGIPAWQRGLLSALRHGDPAYRCLSGILAWQSVLLSGIRHDKLVHRYPRGIILWRSQTGHLPLLIHEIGFFHGHRGLDRVLIHEIGLFHGHCGSGALTRLPRLSEKSAFPNTIGLLQYSERDTIG